MLAISELVTRVTNGSSFDRSLLTSSSNGRPTSVRRRILSAEKSARSTPSVIDIGDPRTTIPSKQRVRFDLSGELGAPNVDVTSTRKLDDTFTVLQPEPSFRESAVRVNGVRWEPTTTGILASPDYYSEMASYDGPVLFEGVGSSIGGDEGEAIDEVNRVVSKMAAEEVGTEAVSKINKLAVIAGEIASHDREIRLGESVEQNFERGKKAQARLSAAVKEMSNEELADIARIGRTQFTLLNELERSHLEMEDARGDHKYRMSAGIPIPEITKGVSEPSLQGWEFQRMIIPWLKDVVKLTDDEMVQILGRIGIKFNPTAHPNGTESDKHLAVRHQIRSIVKSSGLGSGLETGKLYDLSKRYFQVCKTPPKKVTPLDEQVRTSRFYETMVLGGTRTTFELENAVKQCFPGIQLPDKPYVLGSNWACSEGDGHPGITGPMMLAGTRQAVNKGLDIWQRQILNLRNYIEDYREETPGIFNGFGDVESDFPAHELVASNRRKAVASLNRILARIEETRNEFEKRYNKTSIDIVNRDMFAADISQLFSSNREAPYEDISQLSSDLEALKTYLPQNQWSEVDQLLIMARQSGFHVLSRDSRRDAGEEGRAIIHMGELGGLVKKHAYRVHGGQGKRAKEYEELSYRQRIDFLTKRIAVEGTDFNGQLEQFKADDPSQGHMHDSGRMLEVFEAIKEMQAIYGNHITDNHITSNTESLEATLQSIYLAKEAGLITIEKDPDGPGGIKINTTVYFRMLLESPEAFVASYDITVEHLRNPVILAALKAQAVGGKVKYRVMLGGSDGTKRGGFFAGDECKREAEEGVLKAIAEITPELKKHGIEINEVEFFDGIEGTTRGKPVDVDRRIAALTPGSAMKREETIQNKGLDVTFGSRAAAERYFNSALGMQIFLAVSELRPEMEPFKTIREKAPVWKETRTKIAKAQIDRFKTDFFNNEELLPIFAKRFPSDVVSLMKICSRPDKKPGVANSMDAFRAITTSTSYNQSRTSIIHWYGVGSGIQARLDAGEQMIDLQDQYGVDPQFTNQIDAAIIGLQRYRRLIADSYMQDSEFDRMVFEEFQLTSRLIQEVTGRDIFAEEAEGKSPYTCSAAIDQFTYILHAAQSELQDRFHETNSTLSELTADGEDVAVDTTAAGVTPEELQLQVDQINEARAGVMAAIAESINELG